MPPAAIAPPAQHAPPPSFAKLSDDDRRHLAAMDAAVARMKKITPSDPYFVTVPQEETLKYKHQSRAQHYQWAREQPFNGMNEREWQQYMTFKFREPAKDLLALHSYDSVMPNPAVEEKQRNATGTNTPNQAPKKGISFGDYKKKRAGETVGGDNGAEKRKEPSAKQPAVKGPAEKVVSEESAEMLAEIQAIEQEDGAVKVPKETDIQTEAKTNAERQELKRKREDSAKAPAKQSGVNGRTSPPPAKKARTTPPPADIAKEEEKAPTPAPLPNSRPRPNASPVPHANGSETNLPPKLSPLRDKFPGRLTPTLPANIVASLELQKKDKAKEICSLTPSAGQNGVTKHKSPVPRNGFRAGTNSPAGDATKATDTRPVPRSATKEDLPKEVEIQEDHQASVSEKPNNSLVVKLKIKKGNKDSIRRILALPPSSSRKSIQSQHASSDTPRSTSKNGDRGDDARRTGKGVAQKVGPSAKKTNDIERRDFSDKRPRVEAEDTEDAPQPPSSKKRRVEEPQCATTKTVETASDKKPHAETQQVDKVNQKASAESSKEAAEPKPTDILAKRKHQDEPQEQQSASKKAKIDPVQAPKSTSAATPAKDKAVNAGEPQETTTKKKKPDQARYEPPSRKKSSDAGGLHPAPKSKPTSLELKKTPSTPAPHDLQSPTVSSANKSVHLTPGARRDLLSTTRHRDVSNDSQTSTPSGLGNTPLTTGSATSSQPHAAQPNGISKTQPVSMTALQKTWDSERFRLETVGREVKHAASAALNGNASDKKTLSACLALESLLCYLSAYTSADRAALAATDPKQHPTLRVWRSTIGFFPFVQHMTRHNSVLAGLTAALGVVLHARIVQLCMQSQPPISGSGLVETNQGLLRIAAEAEAKFDIDVLMDTFPKTWKARSKGTLPPENELEPKGLLDGGFNLPLGLTTAPMHAARAGLQLLREFIERERLVYEFRLRP